MTGASGFIGRWTCAALLEDGHEVLAVTRRRPAPPGTRPIRADLHAPRTPAPVRDALDRADTVIHAAWTVPPGRYLHDRANLADLDAAVRLVADAVDARIDRFVGVGTCVEHGRTEAVRRADTPAAPASLYAACKHAAHTVGAALCAGTDTAFTWARLFHVAGPDQDPGWLVPRVVAALDAGRPFDLSPGGQVRQWMHVEDVGRALARIATAPSVPPAVQVCAGRPRTLRELLEPLAHDDAERRLLRWGARPYAPGEPLRIVGDPDPLASLGFTPRWDGDTLASALRPPGGRR